MKARVRQPADRILIYGFGEGEEAAFGETAKRVGAELTVISPDSAAETVGYLAGESGYKSCGERFSREGRCVIFRMNEKALDKALAAMRENGLGGIPLKAVLTPSNRSMTLTGLMDELEREHKLMHSNDNK